MPQTMKKITEQQSIYRHLDKMSTREILEKMNNEDHKVAIAVEKTIPQVEKLVEVLVRKFHAGGRLFYIGAGTSGRLGVLDASECPPTYGVPPDWVIGLIAGGDTALRKSVEHAEDDTHQAMKDLGVYHINVNDVVVGIASSGTTPYVVHGLKSCQEQGIATGCITCNPGAPITAYADYSMVAVVGPEFVTGSTRMKSGTAQKLILNMISTTLMIKLGRVVDNRMVDMALSNDKLKDRGTKMLMNQFNIDYEQAREALLDAGSVRAAAERMTKE
ncbi:MAG: N-acetylmuramic acid 6-phosphate etherase [Saprospiraceae bacterium]|nr:N-acetylmuramic acid 6-phosphate etherase [Saprospiraceae bacterium]